jgi:protein-S-isoprenylcysteine O-methyltransferase Ste14
MENMIVLKHIRAIVLLPIVVTIVIPAIIITTTGPRSIGWSVPSPFGIAVPITGILLVGLGLVLLVNTIALFVLVGQGTLAPWDSTQKLVVQGVYSHVRNPMISGVFCILLGEAMFLQSLHLVYWCILFVILNLIYIPLVEEPRLERHFGEDYILYKHNVPRWIPRNRP